MKGLLIKDWKLVKNNAMFLAAIIVISIVCSAVMKNPFFAMGYATALVSIFSINTMAYDEYDNGMTFLFALPVDRKLYVKEKYIFALLITGAGLLISTVIAVVIARFTGVTYESADWAVVMSMSVFVMIVLQAVILPVRMKYDSENHKMAMLIAFGSIFLTGFLVLKMLEMANVDLYSVLDRLFSAGAWGILGIVVIAGSILLYISYKISVCFMQKREF